MIKLFLGFVLAVISAVLLILSFPPINYSILSWIALVPLIIAQFMIAEKNWHSSLFQALTYFIFLDITILSAFPNLNLGWGSLYLWITIAVGVTSLLLFLTGLPSGSIIFHRKTNFNFFLIYPVFGTVGIEFARYVLQLGQMWGMFFIPQHENILLIQLSSLFGIWLISFIVVFVNYSIGLSLIKIRSKEYHRAWKNIVFAVLVILSSHFAGYVLLNDNRKITASVRVAAIQFGTNFEGRDYFSNDRRKMSLSLLRHFENLTLRAVAQKPAIVIWPEAAIWVDPRRHDDILSRLVRLAKDNSIYLVVPYYEERDTRGILNEVITIASNGKIMGTYAKNHPIEFPGYNDGSATRGKYPVFKTEYGNIGNIIGYDVDFTDVARRLTANGAQIIAVSMHDRTTFWYNQFVHNIYRSVENRIVTIRSDWQYSSNVIDQYGHVLIKPYAVESEFILVKDIKVRESGTLYTSIGDIFGIMSMITLFVFFGFDLFFRIKNKEWNKLDAG
jgi:apolipoprotein N-acyltransferase